MDDSLNDKIITLNPSIFGFSCQTEHRYALSLGDQPSCLLNYLLAVQATVVCSFWVSQAFKQKEFWAFICIEMCSKSAGFSSLHTASGLARKVSSPLHWWLHHNVVILHVVMSDMAVKMLIPWKLGQREDDGCLVRVHTLWKRIELIYTWK